MQLTAEIQSKEKNLGELMGRILKEPFKPLSDSIKNLQDRLLDAQDSISEIRDSVNVSAEDSECAKNAVLQTLKKIREEDFPDLTTELQKQIAAQTAVQTRQIAASLDQYNVELQTISSSVLEHFNEAASQRKKLDQSVALADQAAVQTRQIAASLDQYNVELQTISSGVLEHFNEAANQRIKLDQSVANLQTQLDAVSAKQFHAASTAADVAQTALDEIRSSHAAMEASRTTLKNQVAASGALISSDTKASITQLCIVLTEQHLSTQEASQTFLIMLDAAIARQQEIQTSISDLNRQISTVNQTAQAESTALAKVLRQENLNLNTQISVIHAGLKKQMVTTLVFFTSMMAYVGYDIWSKFN